MDPEDELNPNENLEGLEDDQSVGENPAWDVFKQKLTPEFYELIKPELAKQDRSIQKRFESTKEKYGWVDELEKNGVSKDRINQSIAAAELIDKDPLAAYNQLKDFLERSGKLTPTQAQQVAAEAVLGDETLLDDDGSADPRITQLQNQIQGLTAQLETRAQQDQAAQAELMQEQANQALRADITQLREDFKDRNLSQRDLDEILKTAWFKGNQAMQAGINEIPNLHDIAQEYFEWKDEIISAPRAGASAPRLLPTSGANQGSETSTKPVGELSRNETQALVAQYLQSQKQQ